MFDPSKLKDKQFLLKTGMTFAQRNAIVLILGVLIIGIAVANPSFASLPNIRNIAITSSARVIIALGAGLILITAGVDLSAGRTVGLAAVIVASLMQRPDYANKMFASMGEVPVLIGVSTAVLVGLGVGLLNGLAISYLRVPPFIATLGTMVAVFGASSLYIDRPPLGAQPIGGLKEEFTRLGSSNFLNIPGGFPVIVGIAVVVSALIWLILNKTSLGKNIYAIGGNREAAVVSGVNVNQVIITVYTLAGALYGLAGALLAARTGGATNAYGTGYELDAIAACFIGGVSTTGGVGRVSGIITGVLIFEVLNNGLVVLGISAYWQQIIKGLIIVVAVSVDIRQYLQKR